MKKLLCAGLSTLLMVCFCLTPAVQAAKNTAKPDTVIFTVIKGGDRVYNLRTLHLKLPRPFRVKFEPTYYYHDVYDVEFFDHYGKNLGWVSMDSYKSFNFEDNLMPNHCTLASTQKLRTKLGIYTLYTCDCDNGPAASGLKGTHYEYFASLEVRKNIYLQLHFSRHDKTSKSKQEFITLLKGLRVEKPY